MGTAAVRLRLGAGQGARVAGARVSVRTRLVTRWTQSGGSKMRHECEVLT